MTDSQLIIDDFKQYIAVGGFGYQKFPGGLIIQWGSKPGNSGIGTIIFPTAFPNKCLVVSLQGDATQTNALIFNAQWVNSQYTGGFSFTKTQSQTVSYIAIGY
ncbi:MAG: gp53-like domain-containing protein [Ostreibacterium sp.]